MTKDKARKRAAHERAQTTGESYVVARRNVDPTSSGSADTEWMGPVVRTLHSLTHSVPGVPPHSDQRNRKLRDEATPKPEHVPGEPRVLVGLQNWISDRVGLPHQGH